MMILQQTAGLHTVSVHLKNDKNMTVFGIFIENHLKNQKRNISYFQI